MLQSEWLNGGNPRQVNDMNNQEQRQVNDMNNQEQRQMNDMNNQEQRQMMNEDIFSITNASHSIVHTGKIR